MKIILPEKFKIGGCYTVAPSAVLTSTGGFARGPEIVLHGAKLVFRGKTAPKENQLRFELLPTDEDNGKTFVLGYRSQFCEIVE